jgi:hypothetical protein
MKSAIKPLSKDSKSSASRLAEPSNCVESTNKRGEKKIHVGSVVFADFEKRKALANAAQIQDILSSKKTPSRAIALRIDPDTDRLLEYLKYHIHDGDSRTIRESIRCAALLVMEAQRGNSFRLNHLENAPDALEFLGIKLSAEI